MRGRVWRYIGVGFGLVLLIFALAAIGTERENAIRQKHVGGLRFARGVI